MNCRLSTQTDMSVFVREFPSVDKAVKELAKAKRKNPNLITARLVCDDGVVLVWGRNYTALERAAKERL